MKQTIIAEYHYLTVEEQIRRNGYRHEAKGLWWIEQSYDDRARGSFKKALKNYKRADSMTLDPWTAKLFLPLMDMLAAKIVDNILNK